MTYDECLLELGVTHEMHDAKAFAALPHDGWRVLKDQTGSGDQHASWIAAPGPTGWLLVSATKEDGVWFVHSWGEEEHEIPSKAQRAKDLEIRMPESQREWRSGERPRLEAELVNHGPHLYPRYSQDTTFLYGKLKTRSGNDLDDESGIAYSPLDHQDPIAVGQARRIPVHILTRNVHQLAAGDYSLIISLLTLGLDHECPVRITPNP